MFLGRVTDDGSVTVGLFDVNVTCPDHPLTSPRERAKADDVPCSTPTLEEPVKVKFGEAANADVIQADDAAANTMTAKTSLE